MVNREVDRVVGIGVDKELVGVGQGVEVEVVGVKVDEVQLVLVLGLGLDQPSPHGSIEYCFPGCMTPAKARLGTNTRRVIERIIIANSKLSFRRNRIEIK